MVLDMATSVWAQGKIMVYQARGKELPEGIFMDSEGNPTTDPDLYAKGGILRTLGGDIAGYKGFGLSLLVEILTGALTEAGVSNSEEYRSRPFYGGNGIFMMAIDVASVTDLKAFRSSVDCLLRTVKNSPKAPGYDEILIPGEPDRLNKARLLKEGIFIEDKTWNDLVTLAKELKVKIPI
jgi:LDH2 family malate/lactate/ureidoglycolate dehydrogenase